MWWRVGLLLFLFVAFAPAAHALDADDLRALYAAELLSIAEHNGGSYAVSCGDTTVLPRPNPVGDIPVLPLATCVLAKSSGGRAVMFSTDITTDAEDVISHFLLYNDQDIEYPTHILSEDIDLSACSPPQSIEGTEWSLCDDAIDSGHPLNIRLYQRVAAGQVSYLVVSDLSVPFDESLWESISSFFRDLFGISGAGGAFAETSISSFTRGYFAKADALNNPRIVMALFHAPSLDAAEGRAVISYQNFVTDLSGMFSDMPFSAEYALGYDNKQVVSFDALPVDAWHALTSRLRIAVISGSPIPGDVCNNGYLGFDEDCDSGEQRFDTCEDLGYTGGSLSCAADCSFDISSCANCRDADADGFSVSEDVASNVVGVNQEVLLGSVGMKVFSSSDDAYAGARAARSLAGVSVQAVPLPLDAFIERDEELYSLLDEGAEALEPLLSGCSSDIGDDCYRAILQSSSGRAAIAQVADKISVIMRTPLESEDEDDSCPYSCVSDGQCLLSCEVHELCVADPDCSGNSGGSGSGGSVDSDGDGLSDALESSLGTNPNVYDTDNGGVNDGREYYVDGTDPLNPADDGGFGGPGSITGNVVIGSGESGPTSGSVVLSFAGLDDLPLPLASGLDYFTGATLTWEDSASDRSRPVMEVVFRGTSSTPCRERPCGSSALGLTVRYSSDLAHDDEVYQYSEENNIPEEDMDPYYLGEGTNFHQRIPLISPGASWDGSLDVVISWTENSLTIETPADSVTYSLRCDAGFGLSEAREGVVPGRGWALSNWQHDAIQLVDTQFSSSGSGSLQLCSNLEEMYAELTPRCSFENGWVDCGDLQPYSFGRFGETYEELFAGLASEGVDGLFVLDPGSFSSAGSSSGALRVALACAALSQASNNLLAQHGVYASDFVYGLRGSDVTSTAGYPLSYAACREGLNAVLPSVLYYSPGPGVQYLNAISEGLEVDGFVTADPELFITQKSALSDGSYPMDLRAQKNARLLTLLDPEAADLSAYVGSLRASSSAALVVDIDQLVNGGLTSKGELISEIGHSLTSSARPRDVSSPQSVQLLSGSTLYTSSIGVAPPLSLELCDGFSVERANSAGEFVSVASSPTYYSTSGLYRVNLADLSCVLDESIASCTGLALDCDDSRADVSPNAPEICGDGVDNDCDGLIDFADSCDESIDFPVACDFDGSCDAGEPDWCDACYTPPEDDAGACPADWELSATKGAYSFYVRYNAVGNAELKVLSDGRLVNGRVCDFDIADASLGSSEKTVLWDHSYGSLGVETLLVQVSGTSVSARQTASGWSFTYSGSDATVASCFDHDGSSSLQVNGQQLFVDPSITSCEYCECGACAGGASCPSGETCREVTSSIAICVDVDFGCSPECDDGERCIGGICQDLSGI